MANYICECGKPATWFLRDKAGEPVSDRAFAACDTHVLLALQYVVPEKSAHVVIMRVKSRRENSGH